MTEKKRNPQDATLRNIRALKKNVAGLRATSDLTAGRVVALEDAVSGLMEVVEALAKREEPGSWVSWITKRMGQ